MSSDPRVGSQIGDYGIESLLGRGGMSVVYLAEHIRLKRKVALKVLSPELAEDPTFRQRFVSESERLAGLDHPNIIPIFEAGEADGLLYIAMRYVKSTDLKALIVQGGALEPERAASIIAQTASALDAAHAQSLVHRDVKPANILVAIAGGPEGSDHVYLSDFGLTKHTESHSGLTQTGHFMGTIDYVAPEQISGKGVDSRTDQYALGCVLYECLTGKVPFPREEETAALFAHLQDPPPRPTEVRPELPPEIDDVIAKSMAKDKEGRYSSCTEFARAARKALQLGQTRTVDLGQVTPSVRETMIAAPPMALPASPVEPIPGAAPPEAPMPPPVGSPPLPPSGEGPGGGGRSRLPAIIGGVVVVAVIAVIAFTQLGGGGGAEPSPSPSASGSTGTTGASGPTGATGTQFGFGGTLVLDDFSDPTTGWETSPQNGIQRAYVDLTGEESVREVYQFTITDVAPADAFSTSFGPGNAVDLADAYVRATVNVSDKGGSGLLNSAGVSCRTTGTSSYYFLIGVSGRWAIEKLDATGQTSFLNNGTDIAINKGEVTNTIEARCFQGLNGSAVVLQLLVNGKLVGEALDNLDPIVSGAAGVAVTGQTGFVAEFDDFQVSALIVTNPDDVARRIILETSGG